MSEQQYDIYISCLPEGEQIAQAVYSFLQANSYRAFLARPGAEPAPDWKEILNGCNDFLLVETPGCLDNCADPQNRIRQELVTALSGGINTIPIPTADFHYPEAADLPGDIRLLTKIGGVEYTPGFSDVRRKALQRMLVSQPHVALAKSRKPIIIGAVVLIVLFILGMIHRHAILSQNAPQETAPTPTAISSELNADQSPPAPATEPAPQ